MNHILGLHVILFLCLSMLNAASCEGVAEGTSLFNVAPLSNTEVGESVIDPVFGTKIRRLTDSGLNGFATHVYSQLQPLSPDGNYVLLIEDETYTVRHFQRRTLQALDSSCWNSPRWHPARDHTILYFDCNDDTQLNLMQIDVLSGQVGLLFAFPPIYERILGNQSFDAPSRDGRYISGMAALSNGDNMLFTLDLHHNTLVIEKRLSADLYGGPCTPDPQYGEVWPDWVGVSPLGRYMVVQWKRDGTTRCSGLESFSITDGSFAGRAYDGHQHGDLGITADGKNEFFMTFEIYHPSGNQAIAYRMLPGDQNVSLPNYLLELSWFDGHISCRGLNGICVVSTDSQSSSHASPFEGELFSLDLEGNVRRLVHHRSTSCGYWVQPRGSISADGKHLFFASDWMNGSGSNSCNSLSMGAGDLYVAELNCSVGISHKNNLLSPILLWLLN